MKALTKQEVYDWFAVHPEIIAGERSLEFRDSSAPAIHFHYPTGEGQMAFFTRMLCRLDFDESAFAGGLLWMTTWGVWSPWTEDIGHKAIALMRNSKMVSHFMELPGQAFEEHEELEAAVFLLQPMLIGWDAYYYPLFKDHPTDFYILISHDAYVDVVPNGEPAHTRLREFFKKTAFLPNDECHRPQEG